MIIFLHLTIIFTETLILINHANIENEIKSKISDFLGYLENDKEAKEMFETKWISKQN